MKFLSIVVSLCAYLEPLARPPFLSLYRRPGMIRIPASKRSLAAVFNMPQTLCGQAVRSMLRGGVGCIAFRSYPGESGRSRRGAFHSLPQTGRTYDFNRATGESKTLKFRNFCTR